MDGRSPQRVETIVSFLDELRERKLVQWALAYLAGAWVVLQVMDVVGEMFSWSLALQRTIFALLVVGFFVAVVVAWFHGTRGHQRVTGPEIATLSVVLVLGVALTLGLRGPPDRATDRTAPSVAPGDGDSRPSVAVLPFRDLAPGENRGYLAEGVHEEVITQLARIRGLRVISRTSVMRFNGSELPLDQIASELGVSAILEGGVRYAGDSVRITTTLFDAEHDEALWGETYDREATAIFAIQDEVARSVATQLEATLTAEEDRRLDSARPADVDAYDLYQLSRFHFRRFEPEGLERAVELASAAIAADSGFAGAWMALGRASMVMALGHARVGESPADEMQRARRALRQALALEPDLAEARSALALIMGTYDYDLDGAVEAARLAVESLPGDAVAREIHGLLLSTVGRDEEAIRAAEEAVRLDPLAPVIVTNLGWVYLNARRFEDAEREARRALALDEDFHDALALLGRTSIRTGRYEEAAEAYRRGAEVSDESAEDLGGMVYALARAGREEEARAIQDRLVQRAATEFVPPVHVGYGFLGLGEDEEALTWFERAVDERGGWTVWLPRYPEAEHLHDDPRFVALVTRMGLESLLR